MSKHVTLRISGEAERQWNELLADFASPRALVEALLADVYLRRWQAVHANAIIGWSEVRTALQPLDCEYCTCTILSGESYRKADGPAADVYAHAACESAD